MRLGATELFQDWRLFCEGKVRGESYRNPGEVGRWGTAGAVGTVVFCGWDEAELSAGLAVCQAGAGLLGWN